MQLPNSISTFGYGRYFIVISAPDLIPEEGETLPFFHLQEKAPSDEMQIRFEVCNISAKQNYNNFCCSPPKGFTI
jgi:hypothetical protein